MKENIKNLRWYHALIISIILSILTPFSIKWCFKYCYKDFIYTIFDSFNFLTMILQIFSLDFIFQFVVKTLVMFIIFIALFRVLNIKKIISIKSIILILLVFLIMQVSLIVILPNPQGFEGELKDFYNSINQNLDKNKLNSLERLYPSIDYAEDDFETNCITYSSKEKKENDYVLVCFGEDDAKKISNKEMILNGQIAYTKVY